MIACVYLFSFNVKLVNIIKDTRTGLCVFILYMFSKKAIYYLINRTNGTNELTEQILLLGKIENGKIKETNSNF